ncbi:MAG TPA: cytochrome c [Acidimicrobiales bacterium]
MTSRAVGLVLPAVIVVGTALTTMLGLTWPARAQPAPGSPPLPADAPLLARGEVLYQQQCQTCHEADGSGQEAKGIPSLHGVGAAAVDFYLSTGRMPEATLLRQAPRKPPTVGPADRQALVAFVTAAWPGGPPIPTFALHGDLVTGGDMYRTNCAACHGAVGAGAALAHGAYAPTLHKATPLQVAEAARAGPGNMPVFDPSTLGDGQLADIVSYVQYLHHPDDRGGAGLGWVGPIAEGFVGLVLGLAGTVAIAGWVGHRDDDEPQERHA